MKQRKLKVWSEEDYFNWVRRETPLKEKYFAMYSTVWDAIVTNPNLMTIPFDDHMVHRGDGVFDNSLVVNGKVYLLDEHLDRIIRSATAIGIKIPLDKESMRQIILETIAVTGKRDCMARFWISRGTGGFSVYPDESPIGHFYLIITSSPSYPARYYEEGLNVVTSPFPLRQPFTPQVKSCNYLSNAMMEFFAHNVGADTAIAIDSEGNITEGSNKNVAVVTKDGVFKYPPLEKVLHGTMLKRAIYFAKILKDEGILKDVVSANIPISEAYNSAEMMFLSTTLVVAPIVKYDGITIGDGKPGPIYKKIREMFKKDMTENDEVLTPVDYD
jgi:branched-subunit amino acid aminotransferase/4-amino-4-deoxychorismate lyase